MAQRVHIVLEDDLDGGNADETVKFGLDGANYEIDLSANNAASLRDAFAQYVASARRASGNKGGRRSARGRSAGDDASNASQMREWAREHGYTVSDRGRVSADIKAAYDAAH
ncbi:MAG: Lsr2 family protein [Actinomycetota bacterium]|nr:Lsr2 family protein [Nocardioidaceae bacterium]MDQ3481254.1 Lsr2 family protein [Actinomycetota bacterium]